MAMLDIVCGNVPEMPVDTLKSLVLVDRHLCKVLVPELTNRRWIDRQLRLVLRVEISPILCKAKASDLLALDIGSLRRLMSIMLDEQAAGQIRTILRLVKNVIDRSNMTRHDDSAHKCLSFLLTCCETTREKTFSRQVMAYTCLAFHNRFEDAVATMLMPRRRLPKTLRSTSPEEKMRKLLASLKKYVDDGPCKSIKQIVF
jgi:hypothetical protein